MLLERERELGELRSAIAEVTAGRGCAVGIEAAAGLGKTRLLGEARVGGSDAGLCVLAGRATELEQDFPYALTRQLLGTEIARLSEKERERVFEGAAAARGALGQEVDDEGAHETFAVLHALYWVTAALAERTPLLLAVDDTHLADAASLDYLGFLLPRLEELPVLLVVTGRPDEPDPSGGFRRIMTDAFVRHLTLAPLSAAGSAELVADELEKKAVPQFGTVCFEVSGGNPFLLRELSRAIIQRGIEPLAENAEKVRELVPERVAQMVLLRLERLSPDAAALAPALAVLGEGADLLLVAELVDIDAQAAARSCDELRTTFVFDSTPALRFIHPLVRSAVYESIPVGERGAMHRRAAVLLKAHGAGADRLAAQFLSVDPHGDREAVKTLVEAGEGALAAGAPRSAVAYLDRALREPPPDDLREAVLEPLITATFRSADHAAWSRAEPEVLAELERKPSLRSRWATPLTRTMAIQGRFEDAASLLSKAVEVASSQGEVEQAFQLGAQLTTLAQIVPAAVEIDLARYAVEIDPDGPGGRLAAAIDARTAAVDGDAGQAVKAAKRALGDEGIIFVEDPELVAAVMAVIILVIADEVDAAQQAAEQGLAIGREQNIPAGIARGLSLRSLVAWARGDLVNAEADIRQAIDLVKLADIAPLVFLFSAPLVTILIERDELPAAEAQLEILGVSEGPMPANPMFSMMAMSRGHLRFERGEYEQSLEDLLWTSTQIDRFGPVLAANCSPWVVGGLIAAGERPRALGIASDVISGAQRWGAPAAVARAMRAEAAARGGAEGIAMLERAAILLESSPRQLERAYVLTDLGAALRRAGRRADARPPLRSAVKLARQGGAVRVAKRATDELQATGEKVRSYAPIGVESLTPSERRVAELAASGMSNRQIAQSLFVTVKTVEAHLSAAYDKLDIGSRRQLPGALGSDPAA